MLCLSAVWTQVQLVVHCTGTVSSRLYKYSQQHTIQVQIVVQYMHIVQVQIVVQYMYMVQVQIVVQYSIHLVVHCKCTVSSIINTLYRYSQVQLEQNSALLDRILVDASVLQWGQIKTRQLYLSFLPFLFCINNSDALFVIVCIFPQRQHKICNNMVTSNIFAQKHRRIIILTSNTTNFAQVRNLTKNVRKNRRCCNIVACLCVPGRQ